MMGKIIVIEGSCASVGKSTQYSLLAKRLNDEKLNVIQYHFPSHGTYQGRPVEEYLKGNYGKISNLSPYFVNSLYAQDRAISWLGGLKNEYEKGNIILLDRYTTSSLIYQSALIDDKEERDKFIDFVYDYEYHKLGLPIPDIVIFLYVPFNIALGLKENEKNPKLSNNNIHESDYNYMKKVSDVSSYIAKKYNWYFVECYKDNEMLSIDEIHEKVYKIIKETF